MTYTAHFSPRANRQIQTISKRDLPRVIFLLISVFQEPRHPGAVLCRKAAPHQGYEFGDIYALTIGDYRISYEILDSAKTITIAAIDLVDRRSLFARALASARDWLSVAK